MKALVIGGSGTIGRAVTQDLLSYGYEVVLTYNQTSIVELQNLYHGEPVQFLKLDVSKEVQLDAVFKDIKNIDALIYVSGKSQFGLLQDMTNEMIHETYMINVFNLIKITQYFLSELMASDSGRIIVVSSIWGEMGASFETIYSTMKAGQIGFIKALSQELVKTNVTVNAIAPGAVEGTMTNQLNDEDYKLLLEELPQNRLIHPKEIAHSIMYLLSPNAKSITGTVQRINGGWYL
ncbi:elongation factor P 5-aminopentanone reductase [Staphylococcus canis]|uniref:SDR family oxidoreductase n=1 Tax=Staphylococcus canis TaxID=2724942 RepID=A0ABS0T8B3_9STAP|nr:SDR family oxidoreductase [Staphylococcus canis]MBI5974922.1 SDR family oxidoreductase [Staphylococcus canis]